MATMMISEVYDAFIAAGVDQDKARKAAEAIAVFEKRFADIRTDLTVLKWMVGSMFFAMLGGFGLVVRLIIERMPGT